jgi:ABC-2 type transport system ATP-binding protein
VDGLNVTVPRDSFFGFPGPNGAGKSTTIRMLTGPIPPTSDSIELLDMPLDGNELSIKQGVGRSRTTTCLSIASQARSSPCSS